MIGPLTLTLEAGCNGIVSQSLLFEAHLEQFRVAAHQVSHDHHHLDDVLPIGIFLCTIFLFGSRVEIVTFVGFAIFLGPSHRFLELLFVIDAFVYAADNLDLINRFVAHAQIGLEEVCIND